MTTREPRFTELDRAELLALAMYREGLCPLCGRPLRVCTADEETAGFDFVASYTPCHAKMAILETQNLLTDNGTKARPMAPSYLWSTTIRKR